MVGQWATKLTTIVLASIWLSVPAQAASHFETGNQTPLITLAGLDFTIVIPAYIFLGFGSVSQASDSSISSRIVSNSGTLALSLQSPEKAPTFSETSRDTSGSITDSEAKLKFGVDLSGPTDAQADVNSRNETVIYSVSLP
jgi:hypothetical protein